MVGLWLGQREAGGGEGDSGRSVVGAEGGRGWGRGTVVGLWLGQREAGGGAGGQWSVCGWGRGRQEVGEE